MSERIVPKDELEAAIEARKELGAEMEPAVIDASVERIERRLAERDDQGKQSLKRKRDHRRRWCSAGWQSRSLSSPLLRSSRVLRARSPCLLRSW
ncbi:MAG: hypothetical protein H0U03_08790 [Actinobacteria bacterium]|nr:hypothetical protein [Actinomycetota bacterium]